jgi:hypothetical protein
MSTAVKTKASGAATKQAKPAEQATTVTEPKRLSKLGQWKRDNPEGIFEYVDWRAVRK